MSFLFIYILEVIIMKPIIMYDANIIAALDLTDLKKLIEKGDNYITDDIAAELLKSKELYPNNKGYQDKINLIFNPQNGLNDNITLILSHVPLYVSEIFENTKNTKITKNTCISCSMHHFWLPRIISPAMITDPYRNANSLLTWHMQNSALSDKDIHNAKTRIRSLETRRVEKYFKYSNIPFKKLMSTWSKRDTDIKKGKFKISDSRLIMHALNLMFDKQNIIRIITGDYDLIDLSYNLLSSLLDTYTIYETLKTYCAIRTIKENEPIELIIPRKIILDEYEKTIQKYNEDDNANPSFTIEFFCRNDGKLYSQPIIIPVWLQEFMICYRGKMNCYALPEKIYQKYPIHYNYYSTGLANKELIKFQVWKNCRQSYPLTDITKCQMDCTYEMQEINNPTSLSCFMHQ